MLLGLQQKAGAAIEGRLDLICLTCLTSYQLCGKQHEDMVSTQEGPTRGPVLKGSWLGEEVGQTWKVEEEEAGGHRRVGRPPGVPIGRVGGEVAAERGSLVCGIRSIAELAGPVEPSLPQPAAASPRSEPPPSNTSWSALQGAWGRAHPTLSPSGANLDSGQLGLPSFSLGFPSGNGDPETMPPPVW